MACDDIGREVCAISHCHLIGGRRISGDPLTGGWAEEMQQVRGRRLHF